MSNILYLSSIRKSAFPGRIVDSMLWFPHPPRFRANMGWGTAAYETRQRAGLAYRALVSERCWMIKGDGGASLAVPRGPDHPTLTCLGQTLNSSGGSHGPIGVPHIWAQRASPPLARVDWVGSGGWTDAYVAFIRFGQVHLLRFYGLVGGISCGSSVWSGASVAARRLLVLHAWCPWCPTMGVPGPEGSLPQGPRASLCCL